MGLVNKTSDLYLLDVTSKFLDKEMHVNLLPNANKIRQYPQPISLIWCSINEHREYMEVAPKNQAQLLHLDNLRQSKY